MAVLLRAFSRLFEESLKTIESTFFPSFYGLQPQIAGSCQPTFGSAIADTNSEEGFLETGILWAVPKNRRTIEKRWKRKYGHDYYGTKLLLPKSNIRVCDTCGHYHEHSVLCPNCYAKTKQETEAIQAAIQAELGLSPVEKDVVVLYEGEKEGHPSEYWMGKRIIELKRPRPKWFSQNLLQKSVEKSQLSGGSDAKPADLG